MSHNKSHATTARNKSKLMELLHDPANKHCADCKTSKNPRWASWNLGMFICIRCSGIHRSLGTHISRVKSVDLDSWTDEQTESMCNWGNTRANLYWEAKLKPRNEKELELGGYIPMDGKVESFVRTKYVLGKWKDDGDRDYKRYIGVSQTQSIPSNSSTSTLSNSTTSHNNINDNSTNNDPLTSLLDLGSNTTPIPMQKSVSSSSSISTRPSINISKTNPTIALLEQHSGPPQTQQRFQNVDQQRNNRPDLKKSILSLYSSQSPSVSSSNVSLGYNNVSGSSVNTPNINTSYSTSNASVNSNSNFNVWSTPVSSSTKPKNYVDDDPFKNVWS